MATVEQDQIEQMLRQIAVAYKLYSAYDALIKQQNIPEVLQSPWTHASGLPSIYAPADLLNDHRALFPDVSASGLRTNNAFNDVYNSYVNNVTSTKNLASQYLQNVMQSSWAQPLQMQGETVKRIHNNVIYWMKQLDLYVTGNTITYSDVNGPSGVATNKLNLGPIMTQFKRIDPYEGDGSLINNELVRETSEFVVRVTSDSKSGAEKFSARLSQTGQSATFDTIPINGSTTAASGATIRKQAKNLLRNSGFQITSGLTPTLLPDWIVNAASGNWDLKKENGSIKPMRGTYHLWVNPSGGQAVNVSQEIYDRVYPDTEYYAGIALMAPSGFSGGPITFKVLGNGMAAVSGIITSSDVPTSYDGATSHKWFLFGTPHDIPDKTETSDCLRFEIDFDSSIEGDVYIGNAFIHRPANAGGGLFAYAPAQEDPAVGTIGTPDEWRGSVTVVDDGVIQSFMRDALANIIDNAFPSAGSTLLNDSLITS